MLFITSTTFPTEVVIGFNPESYRVAEDAGDINLVVCVLSGMLQTQVSVLFHTNPGSAVGELHITKLTVVTVNVL